MLWAAFECVHPWYLLLHPLVSFTLQQFSLDFVQLQFKAYASKISISRARNILSEICSSLGRTCVQRQTQPGLVLHAGHLCCKKKPNCPGKMCSKLVHRQSLRSFLELALLTPSSSRCKIRLYILTINSSDRSLQGISKLM